MIFASAAIVRTRVKVAHTSTYILNRICARTHTHQIVFITFSHINRVHTLSVRLCSQIILTEQVNDSC